MRCQYLIWPVGGITTRNNDISRGVETARRTLHLYNGAYLIYSGFGYLFGARQRQEQADFCSGKPKSLKVHVSVWQLVVTQMDITLLSKKNPISGIQNTTLFNQSRLFFFDI